MRSLLLLAAASLTWGQLRDCSFAPGWEQVGERRSFEGESLFEYMNGNSEGYLVYGFRQMTGITCRKSGTTALIDLSDMGDPEAAFGIFSANRDVRSPVESIGMGAQILPRKAIVAKGSHYLEIAMEPEGDYREILREVATSLARRIPGQTTPPAALQWFPEEGLQTGFPRLIPQSVLGIRVLKRGYIAQYESGAKAFVVLEASPETAAAALEKLKVRLADPAPLQAPEGGFLGRDKYLGTVAAFRKGRYIGGYAGAEMADVGDLLGALAAKIP